MAKKFFFVCAGIMCLMGGYHLGARTAGAQGSYGIEAAACVRIPGIDYDLKTVVINRVVWVLGGSGPGPQYPEPIPGTARAIAVGEYGVILENGEVWTHANRSSWQLQGIFPAGAVATQGSTWGQVKARYR